MLKVKCGRSLAHWQTDLPTMHLSMGSFFWQASVLACGRFCKEVFFWQVLKYSHRKFRGLACGQVDLSTLSLGKTPYLTIPIACFWKIHPPNFKPPRHKLHKLKTATLQICSHVPLAKKICNYRIACTAFTGLLTDTIWHCLFFPLAHGNQNLLQQ